MKKLFLFILLTAVSGATAFAQKTINDPNAEVRKLSGSFHAIEVSNAFDVYLTQGDDEVVAVSASEEKFKDHIKVEVNDGVLHIRYEDGMKWNSDKMKLKAYISFKNIDKLNVGGACDVYLMNDLKSDNLQITFSGASDLKGDGKLNVDKLFVSLRGASDMKVSGHASKLNVNASGASDFKGYDFVTDYCDVKANGASSIQITVSKELSAQASGASDVHYKGDAVIRDIKTSGASSISHKS